MFKIISSIFVLCITATITVDAQVSYFVKNNGRIVSSVDSADFIRVFDKPEGSSKRYPVSDYYTSGKIKSRGFSTEPNLNLVFTGQYIEYFENGGKKLVATFENGDPKGEIFSYYPNGILYTITERKYLEETGNFEEKISFVQDSFQKAMVTKGLGYFIKYNADFKTIASEGNVVDSLLDGPVKGLLMPEEISYNEIYKQGKLIAGRSKDKAGNIYTYKKGMSDAESKDPDNHFEDYLDINVKKMRADRHLKLPNVVAVQFNISKEGKVTDVWFNTTVSAEANLAIVKMLRAAPVFIPMLKKGVPVESIGSVGF